jgi:uncharacterized protein with HEPN domain
MPRDYKVYLDDILDSIITIEDFVQGIDCPAFASDRKTFDAVVRNLEIIGVAIKNIPEQVRAKRPNVQWMKIASFRDVLAHEYFRVDKEIIWDVVKSKLPDLKKEVEAIVSG